MSLETMTTIEPQRPLTAPRHVQRIIDLTLEGDDKALKRFSEKVGVEMKTVRARAKRIGLTPRFVRGCRLAGTRAGMRDCLRCEDRFLSKGRHNRLCSKCARRS